MNDLDLVSRAQQGDEAAWAALVREHQEAIFRLAYLFLSDTDEAEDVAQETFVRAWKALHRFDHQRPVRPWLLQIAANTARNRQRSLRRYLRALQRIAQATPEQPTHDWSPEQWEAQALWQAVRRLRSVDQEVLYLRYFLDLSETETAHALQVAPGTVKSRLYRALNRLRTVVDQEFPLLREERQV